MSYKPSVLTVPQGGTGQTSFSSGVILVGNSTGVINSISGINNQLVVGQGASADPIFTSAGNIYLSSITINSGTALSSYKEGTFSPTITSSGSPPSVGYNYQVGRYTRIGNRVNVSANVSISSISGGTGTAYIAGLPYTINFSASNSNTGSIITENFTLTANRYTVLTGVPNSTAFAVGTCISAGAAGSYSVSSYTSSSIILYTVSYEV